MDDMTPIENEKNKLEGQDNQPEHLDRLFALKQKLISTKDITKIRPEKVHTLTREFVDAPRDWSKKGTETMTKNLKHPTFFKKFFIFSIIVCLASVVFAYFYLSSGGNVVTNNKINLEVLGNSFVSGGEKANYDIMIQNKNGVNLELASLLIKYDKGVDSKIPASDRIQIGTIMSGETKQLAYTMPVIGSEGDIKNVSFDLEYRIPGSNALFVKNYTTQVTLRTSVLGIGIDAPTISAPNQPYTIKVNLAPSGSDTLHNIALRVEYPQGFTFASSTPKTFSDNNVWYLGDLTASTPQSITISGQVSGFNEEERVFRLYAGEYDQTNNQVSPIYISKIHTVLLNKPFLSARINNDGAIVPIQTGQSVPVVVTWQNNTEQSIKDIEIVASISGPAFDSNSLTIEDKGEYDSSKNTITWDSRTNDQLSLVSSGESGVVSFSFMPKVPGLIAGTNKDAVVTVSIKGTPIDSVSEVKETSSIDTKTYRLGTSVAFEQSALYQNSPLKNTGSNPPKIGAPTTYTVQWVLSNTESVVTGSQVRATLNKNFEWAGAKSPSDEPITYNPTSREIIWNVGDLKRNPAPNIRRQVYFNVSINPKQAQFGEIPTVLDKTIFAGTDSALGNVITQSRKEFKLNNVDGQEVRITK